MAPCSSSAVAGVAAQLKETAFKRLRTEPGPKIAIVVLGRVCRFVQGQGRVFGVIVRTRLGRIFFDGAEAHPPPAEAQEVVNGIGLLAKDVDHVGAPGLTVHVNQPVAQAGVD